MTINEKLDLILDKVTQLEVRVGNLEVRMERLEGRMDAMESRMDTMESRMETVEGRMDTMEVGLRQNRFIMENELNHNIKLIAEGHLDLSRKLDEALEVRDTDVLYHMKVNSLDSEIRRIKDNCQARIQKFQKYQEFQAAALN